MTLTRLWLVTAFAALGVVGVLGATGAVDAGAVLGSWWPVAVVGWGVAGLLVDREVSIGRALLVALGLALLADVQGWASDGVVWPILISVAGLAILFGGGRSSAKGAGCCAGWRSVMR
jgi:hypothetical protein